MAADRCVHAAGHVQAVGRDHLVVEVVAHAVQLLELERPARGQPVHRGDGLRVVGGEHRVDRVARVEQAAGVGQVADVGVRLAGEHRVAAVALDLRPLDLGVPVRALHQAHRDAAPAVARKPRDPVDHEGRALLVGLDHDAEAVPALQRGIAPGGLDHVQRQLQPVGLLGVDGQADAVALRSPGQVEQARRELVQHACALGVLVARMQGRQLDRDRGRDDGVRLAARVAADGIDRAAVGREVAVGVALGERGLAEHVVGVAVVRVAALARARQGLADGAPHHELVAHDLHRLPHREPDHRFADAPDQALEGPVHVAPRVVGEVDQVAGEHQAPGRRVHQHRLRLPDVPLPVRLAELVADQRVGGVLVGDAQQRLGHAHQQHAFLAAEVVLAHEGLDHALVAHARAHAPDQRGRGGGDRGGVAGGHPGLFDEGPDPGGFVRQPVAGDLRAQGSWRRGRFAERMVGHGVGIPPVRPGF